MKIQFQEEMSGTLRDSRGVDHPVDFEVVARSEGRGFFTLEGVGHAPPWLEECPAQGSLVIGPFLRYLRYTVRLSAPDGKTFVLHGEKLPSMLRPLNSMTDMVARLEDERGRVLATGSMQFKLADLPEFVRSWLPLPLPTGERLMQERRALLSGQRAAGSGQRAIFGS